MGDILPSLHIFVKQVSDNHIQPILYMYNISQYIGYRNFLAPQYQH